MKKITLLAIISICGLLACSEKEILSKNSISVQESQRSPKSSENIVEVTLDRPFREMVLGDVIKNPFSVKNMEKALSESTIEGFHRKLLLLEPAIKHNEI